jgi:Spy/CpxP family protein refolding chaperone
MTNMKTKLSVTLLLTALSAAAVMAQDFRPFDHGGGPGAPGTADPASALDRRIAYYKALLTLTDAQVTQATTIFTNAAATTAPLQANLTTARTSLADAVKTNATQTINQLSTQVGTLTGQITAAQNLADAAFYALLTTQQKAILDAVGARGGGPGRGHNDSANF